MMQRPEEIGLDPRRWQAALDLSQEWCAAGRLPAAGVIVGRRDKATQPHLFGRQSAEAGAPPIRSDAVFLVASLTKPLVAMGLLLLVERGRIALGDRVTEYLPEFGKHGKNGVTVRHLLTHTSGLPDMLPDNVELRSAHAPLARFVERTCQIKLDFPPGRGVQYQSMGFAVLGEIIARVSGQPCAEFLRDEIFLPLDMQDTVLGAPAAWYDGPNPQAERIVGVRLPEQQPADSDWHWNSRYWRSLGAPWGGLLTTPCDLARFAQTMLGAGAGGLRLFSRATVAAAVRNQLAEMRDVPRDDRRSRPWGLGWRLNWPAHSANFGDLLGPRTYGHWGATGTLLWIDPDREAFAVILTSQPQEPHGFYLARLSNMIAAAWE